MDVLIIHREDSTLHAIQEKFDLGGWRVSKASGSLEGLELARQQEFDLILCGVDLPVMSGIELIRTLRTDSINKNAPIFLVAKEKPGPQEGKLVEQLEANIKENKNLLADGVVRFGWLD